MYVYNLYMHMVQYNFSSFQFSRLQLMYLGFQWHSTVEEYQAHCYVLYSDLWVQGAWGREICNTISNL